MCKNGFACGEGQIFFCFSSDFAFKLTKEQIFLLVHTLKIIDNIFLCADFRVTGKIFTGLALQK